MIPFNRPYLADEVFAELSSFKANNNLLKAKTYTAQYVDSLTKYGRRVERLSGEDRYTTLGSSRMLRLPLFYGISREQQDTVINLVHDFLK